MRRPKGVKCHVCAPVEWRSVPLMTGSYELDAMILHTSNKDMADRLFAHIANAPDAYGPRGGYDGYSGYRGDD